MAYIKYNENPCNKNTIDCTIRALATLFDVDWEEVYLRLCALGYDMCDMPSSKTVVDQFLRYNGYKKYVCPDRYPFCHTVEEFANENPNGRYLLATDSHVIPLINGNWTDTWDSSTEVILLYWKEI